jgi:hypothetical protein
MRFAIGDVMNYRYFHAAESRTAKARRKTRHRFASHDACCVC